MIGADIDDGGLEHGDIHKEPVVHRAKGGHAVKRASRNKDSARISCFDWASRWGYRFERKGSPHKYRHHPVDK